MTANPFQPPISNHERRGGEACCAITGHSSLVIEGFWILLYSNDRGHQRIESGWRHNGDIPSPLLFPFIHSYIHLFIHLANTHHACYLAGSFGAENTDRNETPYLGGTYPASHLAKGSQDSAKFEQFTKRSQLVKEKQSLIKNRLALLHPPSHRIHITKLPMVPSDRIPNAATWHVPPIHPKPHTLKQSNRPAGRDLPTPTSPTRPSPSPPLRQRLRRVFCCLASSMVVQAKKVSELSKHCSLA